MNMTKKISVMVILFLYTCFNCIAEEYFEFKIDVYSKEQETIFYYYKFDNKKYLSSIQIRKQRYGVDIENEEYLIKRTLGEIFVFKKNNELFLVLHCIDSNNMFISKAAEPGQKYLVTLINDTVYLGIQDNFLERFYQIKNDKNIQFNFFSHQGERYSLPYTSFEIIDDKASLIRYIYSPAFYIKRSDGKFELMPNSEPNLMPYYSISIIKSSKEFKLNILDIFIDEFCGLGIHYPLMWAQLICNAQNEIFNISFNF
jgi:hypothetical protein